MVNIVPVERDRYGGKGWRRPTGYGFASNAAVLPLGGSEFGHAVGAMPIGFVATSAGSYMPVALVAVAQGSNLFVGPGGEWFGSYVPAALRSYPFSLMHTGNSGEPVFGIDEDSGLVRDDPSGEGVEKFFEADGSLTATTKAIAEMLGTLDRDQRVTARAVAALAEAGLIKPWPLTVRVGNQQVTVNGLHWVDEQALNALDDETFLKLRKASALVVAYGHLLSLGQVNVLSRLALLKQMAPAATTADPGMLPV
jgi:hypothetical protein